ncbi:phosphoribosylglycinamide formyltransferase [candidate division TA06 bacterium DG_24]|uniref:Phosphoribosylglycinamide formyltransferase n=3 Tax=Bacteria division TA06 TaxID=1156500 RepID=A0A0S8JLU5_UNCT6|nr:MAG: phosphoribosylglycinamide formyltransferase [candidate division TA06 bacterium DG_24]KPK71353.1 MAG: phosphoribosylglycinamide formyltransferase [candidate division TA06 bacterium SM23_40]KPL10616.1 MAG: phosphoribosylglycinamide formyltransferase [candidate division TA06 bacterium SM1_40]
MITRRLPVGVLASGRGSNLQALIDHIEAGRLDAEIRVVVSDVKDAQALERARRHGIDACYIDPGPRRTILTAEAEERYVQCMRDHGVELIALAGFMRILKERFLAAHAGRILNIHPALLPSFPGLQAQRQAFEYGVKVSGCTVHFVDAGIDTGPIIIQASVPVRDDDTVASLSERILEEEHRIYAEAIQLFAEGRLRVEGRRVIIEGPRVEG